tara:strand:+ start:1949 stop:2176 length:228 start_codon:yes stop_codon:yes gene_type:complete
MSNNKQSSIEFFLKRLIELRVDKNVLYENVHEAYQQAKEMHKEEIMDARRNGSYKATEKYGETRTNLQYYNETFG